MTLAASAGKRLRLLVLGLLLRLRNGEGSLVGQSVRQEAGLESFGLGRLGCGDAGCYEVGLTLELLVCLGPGPGLCLCEA